MKKEHNYIDYCQIDQSFQKSKRIDTDVELQGLSGYHLHESGWQVIKTIVENIKNSKQRAFTITGPYGSGKSSLAILLAASLSESKQLRSKAYSILGEDRSEYYYNCIPNSRRPWLVITVVGGPISIVDAIWNGIEIKTKEHWGPNDPIQGLLSQLPKSLPSLITILTSLAERLKSNKSGMLLLIDEMGKLLEFAANEGGDLYTLQEIAETFARHSDNCLILGFLHQAFGEYGRRVSDNVQAEWTKIQGRFIDIPFSMGIDEVVTLISAAINSNVKFDPVFATMCKSIAQSYRVSGYEFLSESLKKALPLHPLTTLLLGPISRRRFGQNERSVFTFLSSYEPEGFIEFLQEETPTSRHLYRPSDLWDYLQINHEPSILASPDAQRWSEAAEAVLRATNRPSSTTDHIDLAKTIGLLDIFGRAHGLAATESVLETCLLEFPAIKYDERDNKSKSKKMQSSLSAILDDLKDWSIAIPRKHAGGWGLFAGSDIDVDYELNRVHEKISNDYTAILSTLRELSPIVAKRHYAETGTLRLFERKILKASDVDVYISNFNNGIGPSGAFILTLPENSYEKDQTFQFKPTLPKNKPIFIANISKGSKLIEMAIEVAALERLPSIVPHLHGDPVARREVNARLLAARSLLGSAISNEFNIASWDSAILERRVANLGGLSILASEICGKIYHATPKIHNELINKNLPSPTAGAARRKLMNAMIANSNQERLGIKGEPAELGLYLSLLRQPQIHINKGSTNGYEIIAPTLSSSLTPAWSAAAELLSNSDKGISFEEIYSLWRDAPFGMREGVMPILALAFYLVNKSTSAIYIDHNFIPEISELFIDRLLTDPNDVEIRQIIANENWNDHIGEFNTFLNKYNMSETSLITPLDVTKPLVQMALRLSPWAKRTKKISKTTMKIRDALLEASDPYQLLFIDIPIACDILQKNSNRNSIVDISLVIPHLSRCIDELKSATPRLIKSIQSDVIKSLIGSRTKDGDLSQLALRASKLLNSKYDSRLERFIQILDKCNTDTTWIESICSLATGRPLREWTDGDIERCSYEIKQLCDKFKNAEARNIAQSDGSKLLQDTVSDIRSRLSSVGLDQIQQRAALLLALETLTDEAL